MRVGCRWIRRPAQEARRLRRRDVGSEPGHHAEHMSAAALCELRRSRDRDPELPRVRIDRDAGGIHRPRWIHRLRHDADDGERLAAEHQRLSDDVGPASEPFAPERMGQDDDSLSAVYLVIRVEGATQRGRDAERVKEIGRRPHAADGSGPVRRIDREPCGAEQRQGREGAGRRLLPGGVSGPSDPRGRPLAVCSGFFPDEDQSVRVGEGQRPPEDG